MTDSGSEARTRQRRLAGAAAVVLMALVAEQDGAFAVTPTDTPENP